MNDLDLYLEVVSRSCRPSRYIRRWIFRKPRNRGLVPPIGNGIWAHETDDVTWPQRCCDCKCEAVRSAILATAWLLVNWSEIYTFIVIFIKWLVSLFSTYVIITRKPSCRWQTSATRKHAKNCSNSTCLQRCRWQYWSIFIRLDRHVAVANCCIRNLRNPQKFSEDS